MLLISKNVFINASHSPFLLDTRYILSDLIQCEILKTENFPITKRSELEN